jgi:hypothetical protein
LLRNFIELVWKAGSFRGNILGVRNSSS